MPHLYRVLATGSPEGSVPLSSEGLETLHTNAPAEFGGPGDRWSPEHLFVASIADCFILSFRAVARASRLEWQRLSCDVEGELDRVERTLRFTKVRLQPRLEIADEDKRDAALRCLDKAKRACLITNSLDCEVTLEPAVQIAAPA
ncbi:MAG: OsmC family protein [Ectothiorhodospiraceae bacterium]|jgi:organic hydroperoxide reductase OsmC/OhrA